MKKTMIFALSAIMMAAGSVTMNAQEKVVTLDQLLKKNQQKEAPKTEQKAEQKTTQTAQKQKVAKEPKVKAASAGTSLGGFSTAYVQWNFETMKYSKSGFSSSSSGNSISGGFNYAFGIAGATPLYLEPGVALKYVWNKENGVKFSMLSLKVPVNVVYSFAATENFNIEPYAGIYLRGNLLAKEKFEGNGGWDDDWDDWDEWDDDYYSDFDDDEDYYVAPSSSGRSKDSVDLFSKDDMGDDTWNRFQVGLQLGVRARINQKFMVGVGYSQDLSNITDNTKFHSFDISLGICF